MGGFTLTQEWRSWVVLVLLVFLIKVPGCQAATMTADSSVATTSSSSVTLTTDSTSLTTTADTTGMSSSPTTTATTPTATTATPVVCETENLTSTPLSTSAIRVRWNLTEGCRGLNSSGYITVNATSAKTHFSENATSANITDLPIPGQLYEIDVVLLRDSYTSRTTGFTIPSQPRQMNVTSRTETSLAIEWFQDGEFHNFSVSTNGSPKIEGKKEDCSLTSSTAAAAVWRCSVVVNNLPTPGEMYTITIEAMVNYTGVSVSGQPFSTMERTAPAQPKDIESLNRTTDEICFRWNQEGNTSHFEVNVAGQPHVTWNCYETAPSMMVGCVKNLSTPGALYHVTLTAISDVIQSSPSNYSDFTVPSQPRQMNVTSRSKSSLTIEWFQDGEFHNFSILANASGRVEAKEDCNLTSSTSAAAVWRCSVVVKKLPTPGEMYTITVQATVNYTGVSVAGQPFSIVERTAAAKPENITHLNRTADEICFKWHQEGKASEFKVNVTDQEHLNWNYSQLAPATNHTLMMAGCVWNLSTPGALHQVILTAVSDALTIDGSLDLESSSSSHSDWTAPAQPKDIESLNRTTNEICFRWNQEGNTSHFEVDVAGQPHVTWNFSKLVPSMVVEGCLGNLSTPGEKYKIDLFAISFGSNATTGHSDWTAPAQPKDIESLNRTTNEICFKWYQEGNTSHFEVNVAGQPHVTWNCYETAPSMMVGCVGNLSTPGDKYEVNLTAVSTGSNATTEHSDWTEPSNPGGVAGRMELVNRTTTSFCLEWNQTGKYDFFECNVTMANRSRNINNNNPLTKQCPEFHDHSKRSNHSNNNNEYTVQVCLYGLNVPGDLYEVSIAAVVSTAGYGNISSKPTTTAARTLPPKMNRTTCVGSTVDSLLLRPECDRAFESFVADRLVMEVRSNVSGFRSPDDRVENVTSSNATDICGRVLNFTAGVVSGVRYHTRVQLISDSVEGEFSEHSWCSAKPSPVANLTAVACRETDCTIAWNLVGHQDRLVVDCLGDGGAKNCSTINSTGASNVTLVDLTPGALYVAAVTSYANDDSAASPLDFLTVPRSPKRVEAMDASTSTLSVRVDRGVASHGGQCTHHLFTIVQSSDEAEFARNVSIGCEGDSVSFDDLQDDGKFKVVVSRVSDRTTSQGVRLYQRSSEATTTNYTRPSPVEKLRYEINGAGAIVLHWDPPKNHRNVRHYLIVVDGAIHANRTCSNASDETCNSSMRYEFRPTDGRASYNASVVPVNPGWPGAGQFVFVVVPAPGFPGWGIALIVICLLLLAAVIFLALWKNKRMFEKPRPTQPGRDMTAISEISSQSPVPIRIEDFPSEVHLKHKDTDYLFSREYEYLTEISPKYPVTVAERAENRVKNRFVDILAFDHSRVKLTNGEITEFGDVNDYINANFIPGFFSKREYIACQGPMRSTLDHFWQMIWDQKVSVVVMLTKLFEKGKEKCAQYWPDAEETQSYGEISVKAQSISSLNYYELRTFSVSFGNETRTLHHFWFLNWPDFGVPVEEELLSCVRDVRQMSRPQSSAPKVVHCSAGVGRTGTYILLDRALHVLEKDSFIDIFGMVREMREYRCRMVQTEPQYIFVHDCIKSEILRSRKDLEVENNDVIYVNQSFTPEPLYANSTFHNI